MDREDGVTGLTTAAAAAALRVRPDSLRAAAARATRAGVTDEAMGRTRDGTGRSDLWDLDTLTAWWASRPGRGHRTDLRKDET